MNKLTLILLLFASTLLAQATNQEATLMTNTDSVEAMVVNTNSKVHSKYHPKKVRRKIRKIVKKIGKENQLLTEAIGYSGEKPKQYERFELLVAQATDKELIVIMNHPKPAVRGYAFWALSKKYYEDIATIYSQHLDDDEFVFHMQGCVGGNISVNQFMMWVITPRMLDLNCKKLDNETLRTIERR